MDWWALSTFLALAAIAFMAGGAAVRVVGMLALRPGIVALALVAAPVVSVALGTAWSRERTGTPYW